VSRGFDVFDPPDWAWAHEDGTFTNRFDDPGAYRGIPEEERFRVVYCATQPAGAFGETTAHFRKSVKTLAGLQEITDDTPLAPEFSGGIVPEAWRLARHLGSTRLDEDLLFADFTNGQTLTVLREKLAVWLTKFGLEDLDLSTITARQRRVTQEASRYVYELAESGATAFAGIRYMSRLHSPWELWAIFYDRMIHTPEEVSRPIDRNDDGLVEAARVLDLKIE
jgi:hypothetical protein